MLIAHNPLAAGSTCDCSHERLPAWALGTLDFDEFDPAYASAAAVGGKPSDFAQLLNAMHSDPYPLVRATIDTYSRGVSPPVDNA